MSSRRPTGAAVWLTLACIASAAVASSPVWGEQASPPSLDRLVARTFIDGLLEGRPGRAAQVCAEAVSFDGQVVKGQPQLGRALATLARRAQERALTLKKVELLSVEEAIQRFGPPPDRLRALAAPGHRVALARLDQGGVVVFLARRGGFWRVIGLTD